MKKLLSFVAAFLVAVVTAVGVHAAELSPSSSTSASSAKLSDGTAVTVVTSKAALDAATGPAVLVESGAELPVSVGGNYVAFEVETKNIDADTYYDVTVVNDLFDNGTTYAYTHYASDTDATVRDSGTAVASGNTLTIRLHGASPIVIKKAADSAKNSALPKTGVK